jgi:stage IV sporulation protein B
MVVDTGFFINEYQEEVAPCKNILLAGDYITEINDIPVSKKSEFVESVHDSKGSPIELTVRREEKEYTFTVQAQKCTDGEYKLGLWIRDSLQGIGTMTAMTEDGHFLALGHGISDCDTGKVVALDYGRLYETTILAVTNGKKGEPGELNGVIQYQKENIVGEVTANTEQGISGVLRNIDFFGPRKEPLLMT